MDKNEIIYINIVSIAKKCGIIQSDFFTKEELDLILNELENKKLNKDKKEK